ncbi:N-acetyltransferase [Streptomyces sp. cg2]|uniref:N-acetyltransferase n=1 Tax=Streptomyces sp. cg2 TaxID=3238799 RepID=UPI0034E1B391
MDITTLAERPALVPRIYDIDENWPAFIPHDPVAAAYLGRVPEDFPHYCVVATEGERVVARGLSVPFEADVDTDADVDVDGGEELPDGGWDRVLTWAFRDRRAMRGRERHQEHRTRKTVAGALEITVDTACLGRGLSSRMLAALRDAVGRQGHDTLLAPVRPTAKHLEPHVPMAEYIRRRRGDGLPADPWLRVHVRAGGTIEKVAPASMTVSGSLGQWRRWTGLPFDRDGRIEVPGALVPVHCDVAQDHAVYVEPNVWVRHRVERPGPNANR